MKNKNECYRLEVYRKEDAVAGKTYYPDEAGDEELFVLTICGNADKFISEVLNWRQKTIEDAGGEKTGKTPAAVWLKTDVPNKDGVFFFNGGADGIPDALLRCAERAEVDIDNFWFRGVKYNDVKFIEQVDENDVAPPVKATLADVDSESSAYFFKDYFVKLHPKDFYAGTTQIGITPKTAPQSGGRTECVRVPLFYVCSKNDGSNFYVHHGGELKKVLSLRYDDGITLYGLDGSSQSDMEFKARDGIYEHTLKSDGAEYTFIVKYPEVIQRYVSHKYRNNVLHSALLKDFFYTLTDVDAFADITAGKKYMFKRDKNTGGIFKTKAGAYEIAAVPVSDYIGPDFLLDDYGFLKENYEYITENLRARVKGVSFKNGAVKVTLFPRGKQLGVKFEDSDGAGEIITTAEKLMSLNVLPETNITPDMYYLDFKDFSENVWLFSMIKRHIIKEGAKNIMGKFSEKAPQDPDEFERRLYSGASRDFVWDDDIINRLKELINNRENEKEIPNIAIMGEAGTGKSTLVGKIGTIVYNKDIRSLTPGDLKGAYIGHTLPKVSAHILKSLSKGEIIFIDEAYELANDSFGKEAIGLLLTLMTGERTELEGEALETFSLRLKNENGEETTETFSARGSNHDTFKADFKTGAVEKNGMLAGYLPAEQPHIWLGGYEKEIRLLLRKNQGLYRRFIKLTLKKPSADKLYEKFIGIFENNKHNLDKKYDLLKGLFEKNQDGIKDFFRWGSQPHYSKYFGNYGGVRNFYNKCRDGIMLKKDKKGQIIYQPPDIDEIISEFKKEIKQQYNIVRANSKSDDNAEAHEQVQIITDNKTRFSDIAGSGQSKFAANPEKAQFKKEIGFMQGIIEKIVNRELYDKWNVTIPKGALLEGAPGVGKTFLARAMAGELERAAAESALKNPDEPPLLTGFLSVSAPELTSKGTDYIGAVFANAAEYDACILFIDEVDAIAKTRLMNNKYDHFIELLKQMDGIESNTNIFILAATNAPEMLDPAFKRSGRIDKRLKFEYPIKETRRELFKMSFDKRLKNSEIYEDPDFAQGLEILIDELAKKTGGFTPGDIENIINSAFTDFIKEINKRRTKGARQTLKYKSPLADALAKLVFEETEALSMGERRYMSEESDTDRTKNSGRWGTAVHEVGHALMALMSGLEVEKVTSLARGNAEGYTKYSPKTDTYTKEDYEARIRISMGGRAAEETIFGEAQVSAGATQDMRSATETARFMLEQAGLDKDFGLMSLTQAAYRYLGENSYTCSAQYRLKSDEAVNKLLAEQYDKTLKTLMANKWILEHLADKLLEKEEMEGDEFKSHYDELNARLN